jgi:hypothetical protein
MLKIQIYRFVVEYFVQKLTTLSFEKRHHFIILH